MRDGLGAWLGMLIWFAAFGCESAHVEEADGDHRLRSWAALGFDHEWVNLRMQHVVTLHSSADRGFNCVGTLVGPDVVLTAAHCVRDAGYVDESCERVSMDGASRTPLHATFDRQIVLDSGSPFFGFEGTERTSLELSVRAGRAIYSADTFVQSTVPFPHCEVDSDFDMVLLVLDLSPIDGDLAQRREDSKETTDVAPWRLCAFARHQSLAEGAIRIASAAVAW